MSRICTLDELLEKTGIHPTQLHTSCTLEHLQDIAFFLASWQTVAPHLGLSTADMEEVKSNAVSEQRKRKKVLEKWKARFAFKATFRWLIKALLEIGRADEAEKVCYLMQEPKQGIPASMVSASTSGPTRSYANAVFDAHTSSQRTIFPIAKLNPYLHKWTIRAHVTTKPRIKPWSNSRGEGSRLHVKLVDESGEIKATCWNDAAYKYAGIFEVGKVYYISRGRLKPANKQYSWGIENDYELTISDETTVELCTDAVADLSTSQDNLTPITNIENAKVDSSIESSPSDHEEGIPAAKRWKKETATGDTPAETVELNTHETAKKLFDEAMEKGYVESRAIILLLIGAAGAGKSSFKHLILRLSPPAVRQSTPLAEAAIRAVSICRAIIGGEGMEWQRVSSEEMLRIVADAIKAGVSFRSLSPISFPLRVLPHVADNSDLTPTKETTQPDEPSSQPSSDTHRPLPPSTIQLEEEIVDMISQSSGSEKVLDVDWVYVVDSGGQPQFLEMLPAFIRYASACVFVTRLDESLTDHPTIEYYGQGGQQCGTPYPSLLSHEQILQHCSQALQSRRYTSSSPQSGPMVFVAGTHKDLEHHCPETRSAKNRKLLKSLRTIFGDKLVLYRGGDPDQLIFPVNAKTPSRDDEMVASEFRKIVNTSCPHKREQIPIPWFVLEQFIRLYAVEKKVRVVSIKECRQIAKRLHMDDRTFLAALDYLVALNIFHYYPTILPNVLFCDTQVLLDKISELVERSHVLRSSEGASCTGKWLRFRDEGIITLDCLEEFPNHYIPDFFTASDLMKVLCVLFIIAHLAGSEYFMPSLLRELQPEELDSYRCCLTSVLSPLLVHYPGGCLPSGIFTSLIAYLQNDRSWKLFFKYGKPACLYRNCIKFAHPDGQPGSVTLIDSFTHFEVHLASRAPVSRDLCSKISMDIFDGLEKAANTLSYTNLHPKKAIFCSGGGKDCGRTPHPAEVGADHRWWRCLTDMEFGGELTEGQTLWFSVSEQVEALPSPPPPTTVATRSGTARPRIGVDLDSVDGTTVLGEDDRQDVMSVVVDLAGRWQDLGSSLGVRQSDLDTIHLASAHSPRECLRKMFIPWLRQSYNVVRFGKPTWRRLVEAVEDHVGGNDPVLAQRIARKYPAHEALPTAPH